MKKNRQQTTNVIWSKEELAGRRQAMERLHPGFLNMELALSTWLGLVLIGRIFLHGLSIILGAESGWMLLAVPLNLLMCFGFYSVCIRQQWVLAWVFLIIRTGELGKTLIQTLPSLWYLNFWGDLWWVSTIAVLMLDISFLAFIAFVPSAHRCVENRKLVYSAQEFTAPEE
ncbi:MAG: hypothetical protein HFG55_00360 [Lachnospiraceae bacterium]|nr:hypothetical protein [Lachnospiraceae bacterium]